MISLSSYPQTFDHKIRAPSRAATHVTGPVAILDVAEFGLDVAAHQTGVSVGTKSSEYSVRPVQVLMAIVCPLVHVVAYGPLQSHQLSSCRQTIYCFVVGVQKRTLWWV